MLPQLTRATPRLVRLSVLGTPVDVACADEALAGLVDGDWSRCRRGDDIGSDGPVPVELTVAAADGCYGLATTVTQAATLRGQVRSPSVSNCTRASCTASTAASRSPAIILTADTTRGYSVSTNSVTSKCRPSSRRAVRGAGAAVWSDGIEAIRVTGLETGRGTAGESAVMLRPG